MYPHVVFNGSASWKKFLESILKFSHLIIRGLIKGLSPNNAIFSRSSIEMYHYVVNNGHDENF